MSTEYDPKRVRPYKTGELARIFGVSANTIIHWINAGDFGREGDDWRWTKAGPGKGDRIVSARAVHRKIDRNV